MADIYELIAQAEARMRQYAQEEGERAIREAVNEVVRNKLPQERSHILGLADKQAEANLWSRMPQNARRKGTPRGHVHDQEVVGGGADCMFDYLVSDCWEGLEGQTFDSLTGCTFKVYSTFSGAVANANTARQTVGQSTAFYVCGGQYTLTASQTIDPPEDGAYHFYGAGQRKTQILAGANSIALMNIAQLVGTSMVNFKGIYFDAASFTGITLIDLATDARCSISECWLDTGTDSANVAVKPGPGVIGTTLINNFIGGIGIGISDSAQLDCYLIGNTFESGLAIGVKMNNCANFMIDSNTFISDVGIEFSGNAGTTSSTVTGNLFRIVSKGITFLTGTNIQSGFQITGNIFQGIGSGDVGIDFDPMNTSGLAHGIAISGNSFSGSGTGIGIRGDKSASAGCQNSIIIGNSFRGLASGSEIVNWDHTGNEAMHNVSTNSSGVKQALADIGSPVGHTTSSAGSTPAAAVIFRRVLLLMGG